MKKQNVLNNISFKVSRIMEFACLKKFIARTGGFGINEVLGIAAALIIAAFVVIPALRLFATNIIADLGTWWTGISDNIFPVS